jgi:hypothetical protein
MALGPGTIGLRQMAIARTMYAGGSGWGYMKADANPSRVGGYVLRHESRPGYLFVDVTGTRSAPEDSLSALHQIADLCARLRTRKLLISDRAVGAENPAEDIVSIVHALKHSALAKLRLAYFIGSVENLSKLQHAELEGIELGFTLRFFTNARDAEIWLTHGH